MLKQSNLAELEQYDRQHLIRKDVASGAQYKCLLLHLLPGQEIPSHAHHGYEVVLLPQKGQATLTVDGTSQIPLRPGTLYSAGEDSTFHIKNDGAEPFQLLVTLIRLPDLSQKLDVDDEVASFRDETRT